MWAVLGLAAIVTAVLNVFSGSGAKKTEYLRFASMALTALTVCAFYSIGAKMVEGEAWGFLTDTVPTMSKALWVCVILSIMINGITLFQKSK